MKTTRETSSSPGFTKNSMYVMPRRGRSTRVAFTAFLRWGGVGRPRVTTHPRREEEGWTWGWSARSPVSEMGSWGFQDGLSDLRAGRPGSEAGIYGAPTVRGGRRAGLPVLNGLRRGGRPEFGHENADDVEKEDKIDL